MNKREIIEKHFQKDTSWDLFSSAWRQAMSYRSSTEVNDVTVVDLLNSIISEKVNNSRSKFYIYG